VLLMLLVTSLSVSGALLAWSEPESPGPTVRRGLAATPAFLLALAAGAFVWWTAARGHAWVSEHSGEISAWFIATFDRADASLFFRSVQACVFWLQWVLAPLLVLGIMAADLSGGAGAVLRGRWLRRVFAPRRLAAATVWVILLVALPLQVLGWRMSGLPPTWVEPTIVAGRLFAVGLVATIGWSLVCGVATGTDDRRR
jgi:hypothetical protein